MCGVFKVDREDHFQRPGFLHSMCFNRAQSFKILLKKLDVTDVLKTSKVEGHFFAFFVERILMAALTFYGTNFKITNLDLFNKPCFGNSLGPSFVMQLESCLLTARQHGSYNSHTPL